MNKYSNFGNQTAYKKEKAAYCKIDKSNIYKLTNVPKTVKACIYNNKIAVDIDIETLTAIYIAGEQWNNMSLKK